MVRISYSATPSKKGLVPDWQKPIGRLRISNSTITIALETFKISTHLNSMSAYIYVIFSHLLSQVKYAIIFGCLEHTNMFPVSTLNHTSTCGTLHNGHNICPIHYQCVKWLNVHCFFIAGRELNKIFEVCDSCEHHLEGCDRDVTDTNKQLVRIENFEGHLG